MRLKPAMDLVFWWTVWPRGAKKDALKLEGWQKELALSDELRHWFGHDPERWAEFKRRYHAELKKEMGHLQKQQQERVVSLFFFVCFSFLVFPFASSAPRAAAAARWRMLSPRPLAIPPPPRVGLQTKRGLRGAAGLGAGKQSA